MLTDDQPECLHADFIHNVPCLRRYLLRGQLSKASIYFESIGLEAYSANGTELRDILSKADYNVSLDRFDGTLSVSLHAYIRVQRPTFKLTPSRKAHR